MCKVVLARSRPCPWYDRRTAALSSSLPFWQTANGGYVHMVRAAHVHYDDQGRIRHTSYTFWCSGTGFLLPHGKTFSRRGSRGPGELRAEPSPGRVVCATCIGRAIGSGQHQGHRNRIDGLPVKFTPRHGFMRPLPDGEEHGR